MAAWNQSGNQAPENGKVNLDFKHILTKWNVSAQIDEDYEAEFISVKFVNTRNRRTYNYNQSPATIANGTGLGWGAWTTAYTDPTTEIAIVDNISFNYLGINHPVSVVNSATATKLHPTEAQVENSGNIMTIPQTLIKALATEPSTDGDFYNYSSNHELQTSVGTAEPADAGRISQGTYLELIYRMWNTDPAVTVSNAKLGMDDYTDHPYLQTGYTRPTGYKADDIPTTATPLYIKVYIPIDYVTNPNNAYNFVVTLGSTGAGNFFDDTYYDKNGNDTNLPITSDEESIQPITPTDPVDEKLIHFTVTGDAWGDETEKPVQ